VKIFKKGERADEIEELWEPVDEKPHQMEGFEGGR
jgi:hypothetical protein